ncbi:MAG: pantoate--beta-alanine ligase [Bacteroidetes bacterium]|nr:pantoate--beta-alanine ligase [Bacteroidota bacterium]MBS1930105.1 pantoate--beta-alanine ligase [Bacteroidota bacterium]
MILEKKAGDLHKYTEEQHKTKLKVGFVPTMGALHAGHISLIKKSISENDITICSIFINPAQFNDPNDFNKYPVTIEQDIFQVETSGCNLLFLPSVEEIYPKETEAGQHYNLGYIETILEGKFRPGHFMGVCKVMERLLRIVEPDNLYLGQKDYQQCMVIKQLITDLKLDKKIKTIICPTLREPDGLAMSSRNLRLNEQERKDATAIYHTLLYIKDQIHKNEIPEIKRAAEKILTEKGFLVDYVELADANTLKPINRWDGDTIIVVLIAAFMNNVRLIDNMTIN